MYLNEQIPANLKVQIIFLCASTGLLRFKHHLHILNYIYIYIPPPQVIGVLDDCLCDIESIDNFNTYKIFPKIKKLQERDYFRYYKVWL